MDNYIADPRGYHYLTKIMKIDSIGDQDLIDCVIHESPKTICEIGCGTGYLTEKIAKLNKIKLIATDVNIDFLEFAKKRLPNINFLKFNAVSEQLTELVDIMFSRYVYHHIKNKIQFLDNIKKSAKKILILDYFLPEEINYNSALKKYHNYRLKLFKGNAELLKLENESYKLALNGNEEYKVSIKEFHKHIKEAELIIDKHKLITNSKIDNPKLFGLHLFLLKKNNE